MTRILLALVALAATTVAVLATTIYSFSPTLYQGGWAGYSIRMALITTGNSLGQIRVTATNGNSSNTYDHLAYCLSAAPPACDSPPVELTFSSGHGVSFAGAGGTALSDWITFPTAGTSVLVIIDYNSGSAGSQAYNTGTGAGTLFYKAATASWNVQSPAGFTNAGTRTDIVSLIETQSAGGGSSRLLLMGVQ